MVSRRRILGDRETTLPLLTANFPIWQARLRLDVCFVLKNFDLALYGAAGWKTLERLGPKKSGDPSSRSSQVTHPSYDQIQAILSRGGIDKRREREFWDGLFLSPAEIDDLLKHVR